jgi:hypothetical protein
VVLDGLAHHFRLHPVLRPRQRPGHAVGRQHRQRERRQRQRLQPALVLQAPVHRLARCGHAVHGQPVARRVVDGFHPRRHVRMRHAAQERHAVASSRATPSASAWIHTTSAGSGRRARCARRWTGTRPDRRGAPRCHTARCAARATARR